MVNNLNTILRPPLKTYDDAKKASQATQNSALIKVMALIEPKGWEAVCEKDPDLSSLVRYEWSRLTMTDKKLITLKMQST